MMVNANNYYTNGSGPDFPNRTSAEIHAPRRLQMEIMAYSDSEYREPM